MSTLSRRGGAERERERADATETTCWKGETVSDGRKHSKIECRICKVKISYEAGSTNNLHRHIRTVHPSVQLEEKRQESEPAANESASLSTATVAAAAAVLQCLQ